MCTKKIKTCSSLCIHPGFSAPLQVALAVSLNLRTYLRLNTSNDGKVCINLPNIDTFLSWDLSELKKLIPYMCKRWWSTFIHLHMVALLQFCSIYHAITITYVSFWYIYSSRCVLLWYYFCDADGGSCLQLKERRPNVWMLNSWGGCVNFWIYPTEAWIRATWPS